MAKHAGSTQEPTDHWDATVYDANARFVSTLGQGVVDWLKPRRGERILDVGCGDGVLTRDLVAAGCRVLGIDASPAMVAAARAKGIDAVVADAQHWRSDERFDAVFSNAALHWMKAADRVAQMMFAALRPGGRLVAEFGGAGNVATIVEGLSVVLARRGIDMAALDPWYFPSPEAYRAVLEPAGFSVQQISLFERPTPLPGDVTGWLQTFAGSVLAELDESAREQVLGEVREHVRGRLCNIDGRWHADYVRLRVHALKPEDRA